MMLLVTSLFAGDNTVKNYYQKTWAPSLGLPFNEKVRLGWFIEEPLTLEQIQMQLDKRQAELEMEYQDALRKSELEYKEKLQQAEIDKTTIKTKADSRARNIWLVGMAAGVIMFVWGLCVVFIKKNGDGIDVAVAGLIIAGSCSVSAMYLEYAIFIMGPVMLALVIYGIVIAIQRSKHKEEAQVNEQVAEVAIKTCEIAKSEPAWNDAAKAATYKLQASVSDKVVSKIEKVREKLGIA